MRILRTYRLAFNDIWYKRIDTEYQMVRFIVYKIKFCWGLYSRDGSSYNLSNIILYLQYLIDSMINSQNIDILKQKYSCRLIGKKHSDMKMNANSTQCSQAVTHPSTNRAQHCLTSVIGRELVCSMWYGRRQERRSKKGLISQNLLPPYQTKRMGLPFVIFHRKIGWIWQQKSKGCLPTAPRVPRRSPIQVLTRLNVA